MQRPWNLVNLPIYSLATYEGAKVNMNICTYVSAVSMSPKQYMIAVYKNTKSLENLTNNGRVVLQLLAKTQVSIVNVLGKKTGFKYDKQEYMLNRNLLQTWNGNVVLSDCAALVELKKKWRKDTGDHVMFLFDVKQVQTRHTEVLMLNDLRARKLVRI